MELLNILQEGIRSLQQCIEWLQKDFDWKIPGKIIKKCWRIYTAPVLDYKPRMPPAETGGIRDNMIKHHPLHSSRGISRNFSQRNGYPCVRSSMDISDPYETMVI